MAILVDPTYLTVDQFIAMYGTDTLSLTSDQLQILLQNASAAADSIMKRTLFATEILEYFGGSGDSTLALQREPLAYVSQIAFAQPGLQGYTVAKQNVLIDYPTGILKLYQPIALQGVGLYSVWPRNITVAIRYAYGYGYGPVAPTWTYMDTPGYANSPFFLAPGQYDVAITSATPWGETLATPQTITTVSGATTVTVQTVLGAERYRVYITPTGSGQPLVLCAEVPAVTFSQQALVANITKSSPLDSNFQQTLPTVDTSVHAYPSFVQEAVYWLAQDKMTQINSPANSGLIKDVDLGFGQLGQFSKGVSPYYQNALNLLAPKKLNAIFVA